jgi:hypothetical protein
MKMKMKRQGTTKLPRFVVGALATAGASAASGATVQITFADNVVSSFGGNNSFSPYLTGDDNPDVTSSRWSATAAGASAKLRLMNYDRVAMARSVTSFGRPGRFASATVMSAGYAMVLDGAGLAVRGLVPITFGDASIHDGTPTSGWMDVEARSSVSGEHSVRIHRLIFDDSSPNAPTDVAYTDVAYSEWVAVPEPSSLGLLALGAGGLLARRRRSQAA